MQIERLWQSITHENVPCTRCKLCFITFNLTERFWLIVIPYTTQHWPGNVYLHYPPDA